FYRAAQRGSSYRVVDYQQYAVLFGDRRKLSEVRDYACRVSYRFQEYGFGLVVDQAFDLFGRSVVGNESAVDPQSAQRDIEQVERTAVDRRRRNKIVARA